MLSCDIASLSCTVDIASSKKWMSITGAVFQPNEGLWKAVCNVICSIMFGERFEYNNPDFLMLYSAVFAYFDVLCSPAGMVRNLSGICEKKRKKDFTTAS